MATTGVDGHLRAWDFRRRTLRADINLGSPVRRATNHPGTGLLAAACADNVIRMCDVQVGTPLPAVGWKGAGARGRASRRGLRPHCLRCPPRLHVLMMTQLAPVGAAKPLIPGGS